MIGRRCGSALHPAPASSAANALRLTIPRAVTLGTSTWIGFAIPNSIGPTGSPSDADAVYFQVGTLVMADYLKPVDPLPRDPELLGWGHLMPVRSSERRR